MNKKIISIDLDGVLNTYSGYKDYNEKQICPIKPGAFEFLKKLHSKFEIEIFTVRNKKLAEKWLQDNDLKQFISCVTDKKNPYSSLILDDRAINFDGNFDSAYEKIVQFNPYWGKKINAESSK